MYPSESWKVTPSSNRLSPTPNAKSTKRWTTDKLWQVWRKPLQTNLVRWEMSQKRLRKSHTCTSMRFLHAVHLLGETLTIHTAVNYAVYSPAEPSTLPVPDRRIDLLASLAGKSIICVIPEAVLSRGTLFVHHTVLRPRHLSRRESHKNTYQRRSCRSVSDLPRYSTFNPIAWSTTTNAKTTMSESTLRKPSSSCRSKCTTTPFIQRPDRCPQFLIDVQKDRGQ